MRRIIRGPAGFALIELTIVILIIAILEAIAVAVYLNARGNAQRRTCQSNLRTVDGASQTHEDMFDVPMYPDSLATMVTGGAGGETRCLKSTPVCASGTAAHLWVTGTPPEIYCPNVSNHQI